MRKTPLEECDNDEELIIMMNCFRGMVDRRKAFSLITRGDHFQRFSPSQMPDTLRAGFETVQNLCRVPALLIEVAQK